MSKDCIVCSNKIRDRAPICAFCGEWQQSPSSVTYRETPQLDLVRHWDGKASLQGIDLSGCDLSNVDLQRANLQGANLEGANLYSANLDRAQLQNANLRAAVIFVSNLEHASLTAT